MTVRTAPPADRQVTFTRVFDAPRSLVWKAWTDPEQFARWWGPKPFSNPVCKLDVRPGGVWHIVMRSPDGVDYPIKGIYREVAEPSRLVMTCNVSDHPAEWHALLKQHRGAAAGEPATEVLFTVTFEETGGRTTLTIRSDFPSAADCDAYVKMGMEPGWNQSLDRLAELLAKA